MKNINNPSIKRCGIGTLSLVISIFSIMFTFSSISGKDIGKYILSTLGLLIPVTIISVPLFLISIYIGNKYKNNLGATAGKNLSILFLIIMMILSITSLLFN